MAAPEHAMWHADVSMTSFGMTPLFVRGLMMSAMHSAPSAMCHADVSMMSSMPGAMCRVDVNMMSA